ncbi:MAG: response regulator transcription factor [Coriobacteriia bacterium]
MSEPELSAVEKFSFSSSGLIGFSATLLSMFLLFFKPPLTELTVAGLPASVLLVVICAVLLLVAKWANDRLASDLGGRWVLGAAAVGTVLAPATFLVIGPVLLPVVAVGIVCLVLVWGSFLSTLTHRELAFSTSIAFTLAGVLCLFFAETKPLVVIVISAALALLSCVCGLLVREGCLALIPFTTAAASREHSIAGKGNRYTLFMIGLTLGAAAIITSYGVPSSTITIVLGISTLAAGVIAQVLRRIQEHHFEDFMRRYLAVCVVVLTLPIPFLFVTGRLIVGGLFLVFLLVNFIILVDAVAETARFNIISPIWIIGKEGAISALGIACGMALFWWGFSFSAWPYALMVACFVLVALSSVLQVFIADLAYPSLPEAKESLPEEERVQDDVETVHSARKRAVWRAKLDAVTVQHGLSPRQKEVMELLAKGRDSKYIQDHFVISRSTAKTHVYNLYRKLGIHSRQDLIDLIEHVEIPAEPAENLSAEVLSSH